MAAGALSRTIQHTNNYAQKEGIKRIGMSEIIQGDSLTVLKGLPDQHVNCVVTSPPYYGLRDYGVLGQMGLEPTPDEYVQKMVELFREVRRVLMDDGTLWLNIGDSYAGYLGNESYKQGEATTHFQGRPAW